MTTSTQTTAGLLEAVLDDLAWVVEAITPAEVHDPTPSTEWDVGQLRDHVVGWLARFAAEFADPGGQAPRASLDSYEPPPTRRGGADGGLHAHRRGPGGAASRPLRLGASAMSGEMALNMILREYQVHGWDLDCATGQDWRPPGPRRVADFAPAMLTEVYQGEGKPSGNRSRSPLPRRRRVALPRRGVARAWRCEARRGGPVLGWARPRRSDWS